MTCPGYQRILKYGGREDKATFHKRLRYHGMEGHFQRWTGTYSDEGQMLKRQLSNPFPVVNSHYQPS